MRGLLGCEGLCGGNGLLIWEVLLSGEGLRPRVLVRHGAKRPSLRDPFAQALFGLAG